MKVLIVEDDPGTCQMLETVLATAGHSCRIVTSGSAAIMAALTEEHDLLICDMGLPDLPGSEIIRAIKAQSPRLPVVAIGDDSADVWEQQVLDAGGSCYLPRPVHEEDLRMEVNMVEKARLQLNIVLVDPDAIHRIWVGKTLESLGCQVQSFDTVVNAQIVLPQVNSSSLIIVNASTPYAPDFIKLVKDKGAASFAFDEKYDPAMEDALMRAGAAFLLSKPINIDQLLTQAAFLSSPF